jgi:hypothetical protein
MGVFRKVKGYNSAILNRMLGFEAVQNPTGIFSITIDSF